MKEMTKAQIQERQLAIWNRIELDEAGKTRELTAEEVKEQRELVDESAKLSTRAKALASGAELAAIKSREDKGKELREMIADCFTHKRAANATTILANAITSGPDQNEKANLEAGGLIPVEIQPIIDTKVPGIELPDDLKMLTGVTGTQVIPYHLSEARLRQCSRQPSCRGSGRIRHHRLPDLQVHQGLGYVPCSPRLRSR